MKDKVIEHYNKLSKNYESLYIGKSLQSYFYNIRRIRMLELLDKMKPGKILEVGCGAGMMVEGILAQGWDYHGVDSSPGMIDVCKRRFSGLERAVFTVADSENLELPSSRFDVLLSLGMLEYVPREQAAVREMARVIKDDGALCISGNAKWSPHNAWNRWVYRKLFRSRPAAIIKEYHRESEYCKMMALEGLMVSEVVHFDFNIFPSPLDKYFVGSVEAVAKRLQNNSEGVCKVLANGFVMTFVKKEEKD